MSGRIFISHSAADARLGGCLAEFFEAMLDGVQVEGSSLPGREPASGQDAMAGLKQRLASADVVIGLITPQALASGEVPFQLGAAWSLGTKLLLLLAADGGGADLYLPVGHADVLVLGPETLLELAASLAGAAGSSAEMNPRARAALAELYPDFRLERESSERLIESERPAGTTTQQLWPINEDGEPVRPPEAARPALPSCTAALNAGRALSDCVFHRDSGSGFAAELDAPFGTFLSALGSDWNALRKLDDLDVWVEAAENVLGALGPGERRVRAFYELGFQLATVINMANLALERSDGAATEASAPWRSAWQASLAAAAEAGLAQELAALEPLVENLFAAQGQRDFANLGRVQERVRELATLADAAGQAPAAQPGELPQVAEATRLS